MPLTHADCARLRSLREKKHREALGAFVVEGAKVVGELLAARYPFTALYATPAWVAPPAAPEIVRVTAAEMARLSHYPTPSPVLAVGRVARPPLSPGTLDQGLTLALDGLQDPGNTGALLRLADWFAFDRVLLSPDGADLFSQKVINASMGSFARVVVHTVPLAAALAGCAAPVLGCDLVGDAVYDLPPWRDAVVVVGREGRGLSAAVAARLTRRVTIPRFGGAESLNAALAAAIVCAQLRRPGG